MDRRRPHAGGAIDRVRSIRDKLLFVLDLEEAELVRGGTDGGTDAPPIQEPPQDEKRKQRSWSGDFRNFPNFPNFSNWRNQ